MRRAIMIVAWLGYVENRRAPKGFKPSIRSNSGRVVATPMLFLACAQCGVVSDLAHAMK